MSYQSADKAHLIINNSKLINHRDNYNIERVFASEKWKLLCSITFNKQLHQKAKFKINLNHCFISDMSIKLFTDQWMVKKIQSL